MKMRGKCLVLVFLKYKSVVRGFPWSWSYFKSSWEFPNVDRNLKPGPLQKQRMLFTAEPSPSPILGNLICHRIFRYWLLSVPLWVDIIFQFYFALFTYFFCVLLFVHTCQYLCRTQRTIWFSSSTKGSNGSQFSCQWIPVLLPSTFLSWAIFLALLITS